MTGTYEGKLNGTVGIDITNSASSNAICCYVNSSDMDTYTDTAIRDGEDGTIAVACGSVLAIIMASDRTEVEMRDWNDELISIYSGIGYGAAFYVPLDAVGVAHIVITDY